MDYQKLIETRNNSSTFRRLLGIRLVKLSDDVAEGELIVTGNLENQIHSLAGGCIYSLADSTAGAICATTGYKATTVNADFHYLSAGLHCTKITAKAKTLKKGKRLCVIDVDIKDQDGKLLASGTFTFAFLPEKIDYL